MIDKFLGQAVNAIGKFLNSPGVKNTLIRVGTQQVARFVVREKLVEKGWEGLTEFVSSTQVKITYRNKESEVVIDAATTKYQVGNVKNSQVLQGKENVLVINNYSFKVNLNVDNANEFINLLRLISHEFKLTERELFELLRVSSGQLNESTIVKAEKINQKVDQLSLKLSSTLSNVGIDYSLLQQALKTQ